MTASAFEPVLRPALERIGADLGALVGVAVAFDADALRPGLGTLDGGVYVSTTRRSDDRASEVGFVVPDAVAVRLTSALLMLPDDVTEMSEDAELAFEEVVNILLGAWKASAARPEDRLSTEVADRSQRHEDAAELRAVLGEQGVGALTIPVTIGPERAAVGIFGPASWLDVPPLTPDGVPAGPAKSEPEPAEQPPEPSRAASRVGSERDGYLMLIDRSGELARWVKRQLRQQTLALVRASPAREELDGRETVVLVDADPDVLRELDVEMCVVARKR
ncbi:MAG: hypothetical protein ACQEXJ_09635 [Myxococcota bacterium]